MAKVVCDRIKEEDSLDNAASYVEDKAVDQNASKRRTLYCFPSISAVSQDPHIQEVPASVLW